jgi:hypothetical protein
MPLPDLLGIELHREVGRDTAVLHLAVAACAPDQHRGHFRDASIHELGDVKGAGETAPGPFADDRPEVQLPEIERQRVAAGAGILVDEQRLRAGDARRVRADGLLPARGETQRRAGELFQHRARQRAAEVEALVEDHPFFLDLSIELLIEAIEAVFQCVRDIDVGDTPVRQPIDGPAILLDPRPLAE